jgi:hypothetical protein
MARLSGDSVTKSSLLPASAMMMFSLAWRWSSLTHALALSSDACLGSVLDYKNNAGCYTTYSLCNIVYYDGAVCISVVHGRERLVALLASRIPDLELYSCVLVEGNGLGEEGGADGRFSVVIELVLDEAQYERRLRAC